ncbi:hypothetical protein D5086_023804 [Populus alba]|uniref:Uncharacterized protein n=1 Tax=Populus alba TaxID=43335 RepID=A0ACC4BCP7_POPAL
MLLSPTAKAHSNRNESGLHSSNPPAYSIVSILILVNMGQGLLLQWVRLLAVSRVLLLYDMLSHLTTGVEQTAVRNTSVIIDRRSQEQ